MRAIMGCIHCFYAKRVVHYHSFPFFLPSPTHLPLSPFVLSFSKSYPLLSTRLIGESTWWKWSKCNHATRISTISMSAPKTPRSAGHSQRSARALPLDCIDVLVLLACHRHRNSSFKPNKSNSNAVFLWPLKRFHTNKVWHYCCAWFKMDGLLYLTV